MFLVFFVKQAGGFDDEGRLDLEGVGLVGQHHTSELQQLEVRFGAEEGCSSSCSNISDGDSYLHCELCAAGISSDASDGEN